MRANTCRNDPATYAGMAMGRFARGLTRRERRLWSGDFGNRATGPGAIFGKWIVRLLSVLVFALAILVVILAIATVATRWSVFENDPAVGSQWRQ
jgi:hypothetical protein